VSTKRIMMLGIFFSLLCMLFFSRIESEFNYASEKAVFSEPISNEVMLQAISGFVPGLSADFQIMHVFSVSDAMTYSGQISYAPLMATYLKNASKLDPRFVDTYRLASSLLVYDANMPQEGVDILDYGSKILTNNWEFPFLGGFIAHEQLHDDNKAFELMSRVLTRPHAPQLAVNLATKYLNNTQTKEDALLFLQLLLQTMPEKYQEGIKNKISQLQNSDIQ